METIETTVAETKKPRKPAMPENQKAEYASALKFIADAEKNFAQAAEILGSIPDPHVDVVRDAEFCTAKVESLGKWLGYRDPSRKPAESIEAKTAKVEKLRAQTEKLQAEIDALLAAK